MSLYFAQLKDGTNLVVNCSRAVLVSRAMYQKYNSHPKRLPRMIDRSEARRLIIQCELPFELPEAPIINEDLSFTWPEYIPENQYSHKLSLMGTLITTELMNARSNLTSIM